MLMSYAPPDTTLLQGGKRFCGTLRARKQDKCRIGGRRGCTALRALLVGGCVYVDGTILSTFPYVRHWKGRPSLGIGSPCSERPEFRYRNNMDQCDESASSYIPLKTNLCKTSSPMALKHDSRLGGRRRCHRALMGLADWEEALDSHSPVFHQLRHHHSLSDPFPVKVR